MGLLRFLFFGLALLLTSCGHGPHKHPKVDSLGLVKFKGAEKQKITRVKNTNWKACPPALPKPCQIHLIEGSPKAQDLFALRFKLGDTFAMAAHTHPAEERVTVISGQLAIGFGKEATKQSALKFDPGDHYITKRGEVHKVWAMKNTVIQIIGLGPWKTDYVK